MLARLVDHLGEASLIVDKLTCDEPVVCPLILLRRDFTVW